MINRRANKQPAHPTGSQGASQVAWHVAPRRGSDTAGGGGGACCSSQRSRGNTNKDVAQRLSLSPLSRSSLSSLPPPPPLSTLPGNQAGLGGEGRRPEPSRCSSSAAQNQLICSPKAAERKHASPAAVLRGSQSATLLRGRARLHPREDALKDARSNQRGESCFCHSCSSSTSLSRNLFTWVKKYLEICEVCVSTAPQSSGKCMKIRRLALGGGGSGGGGGALQVLTIVPQILQLFQNLFGGLLHLAP